MELLTTLQQLAATLRFSLHNIQNSVLWKLRPFSIASSYLTRRFGSARLLSTVYDHQIQYNGNGEGPSISGHADFAEINCPETLHSTIILSSGEIFQNSSAEGQRPTDLLLWIYKTTGCSNAPWTFTRSSGALPSTYERNFNTTTSICCWTSWLSGQLHLRQWNSTISTTKSITRGPQISDGSPPTSPKTEGPRPPDIPVRAVGRPLHF